MDIQFLERHIMTTSKPLELDVYDLHDIVKEREYNIKKGVNIAKELENVKLSNDDIKDELKDIPLKIEVMSELLDEWKGYFDDGLHQDLSNLIKDFEQLTKVLQADCKAIESGLESITGINNNDY